MRQSLGRLARRQVRWGLVRFLYRMADILGKTQRLVRPAPVVAHAEDRIRRILVIRLDLLGDLVMTLPAVEALRARWPAATITVLCTPAAQEIARRSAAVDDVLVFNPNVVRSLGWWPRPSNYAALFALVGQLRSRRFDLAMSMFGEFACLFAWASGARHRVGYREEGYPALLTLAVPGRRYFQARGHEVQWNEHLAAAVGAPSIGARPRLEPPDDQRAWLAAFRERHAIGAAGYIVLSAGAHNGSAKRYLLDRWATVANALVARWGVRLVLTGAASERHLAARLTAALHEPAIVVAGETSVPQLLALLAGARLLLAGDSGPTHLAAALGTPVVAIFGPTDPTIYRPYTPGAIILRTDLPCSPCYDLRSTAECRLGYTVPLCMALLPPARVVAAADQFLATTAMPDDVERPAAPAEVAAPAAPL